MALPKTFVEGFHDKLAVSRMPYNKFGETDMVVSRLAMGGFQLGTVFGTDGEDEAVQTVIKAVKSGINLIDTAPWYGFGNSEIVLGKALKYIPRNAYYVATKIGRYLPECHLMFDYSARKTMESVDESLKKLGLDYVDIIQVHDLEFAPSVDILVNETLPTLEKVVRDGKARYIGITGYSLEKLKEVAAKSSVKLSAVQSYSRYTIFNQSLRDYIPFFQEQHLGIINSAILGMGLLTPNPPPSWHPGTEELKLVCQNAKEYCLKNEVSLPKLAINYVMKISEVSTNIVGFCTLDFLEMNFRWALEELNEKEKSVLDHLMQNYFGPMKQTHWENIEVNKYHRKLKEYQYLLQQEQK